MTQTITLSKDVFEITELWQGRVHKERSPIALNDFEIISALFGDTTRDKLNVYMINDGLDGFVLFMYNSLIINLNGVLQFRPYRTVESMSLDNQMTRSGLQVVTTVTPILYVHFTDGFVLALKSNDAVNMADIKESPFYNFHRRLIGRTNF